MEADVARQPAEEGNAVAPTGINSAQSQSGRSGAAPLQKRRPFEAQGKLETGVTRRRVARLRRSEFFRVLIPALTGWANL